MTFGKNLARGAALGALALGLTLSSVNAQNGTNYHVIHNGLDVAYAGIGIPGGATHLDDGMGTYVQGEDMRGSTLVDFGGLGIQFSYKQNRFREAVCIFANPIGGGGLQISFPGILFVEMDGLNGNAPAIFTNPVCAAGLGSFIPYGVGPASTFSFLLAGMPSGIGVTGVSTATVMLLPENGLLNSAGGTATIVAAAGNVSLGLPAGSGSFGCWLVQFTWTPTAVQFLDDIDGMWHWMTDSADANQYAAMSDDELNIWQSNSLYLNDNFGLVPFVASTDYSLLMATAEPVTRVALMPAGWENNGAYYNQTENMVGAGGANQGFDVGRGSGAISFSGASGAAAGNPNNVSGFNQNAGNNPTHPSAPLVTTLSFVTWNNSVKAPLTGTGAAQRVWLCIDHPMLNNFTFPFAPPANPAADPGIIKDVGTSRLPVHATGFIQNVTSLGLTFFPHVSAAASSGWPDPEGLASGAFGVPAIAGGSFTIAIGGFAGSVPCGIGLPVNLTYGSTSDNPAPPPVLNFKAGTISGSMQSFLFN